MSGPRLALEGRVGAHAPVTTEMLGRRPVPVLAQAMPHLGVTWVSAWDPAPAIRWQQCPLAGIMLTSPQRGLQSCP